MRWLPKLPVALALGSPSPACSAEAGAATAHLRALAAARSRKSRAAIKVPALITSQLDLLIPIYSNFDIL